MAFSLPVQEELLKEIKNAVDSAAIVLAEEAQLKEQRKDLAQEMKDKFDMPKGLFNKMARVAYEQSFEEETEEAYLFEKSFETIMRGVVSE